MMEQNILTGEFDVLVEQRNTTQESRIFGVDRIEKRGNHIFVYSGEELRYKAWLRNKDEDIKESMKDIGMRVYER